MTDRVASKCLDSTNTRANVSPLTGPVISGHRYNARARIADRYDEMQLIISGKAVNGREGERNGTRLIN